MPLHRGESALSARGLSVGGRDHSGLDRIEGGRQDSSQTRKLNFLKSQFELN